MGTITHVCRVTALHEDAGTVGVTAIDKRAVDGAVKVGRYGVHGDVQADRQHHGGADKALYVLDQAEADHWAAELGEEVPAGRFGENLRVVGLAVDDAEIGERWRIGETLEVEVTGPRTPCATFGRWLGQERWVKRFTEHGRTGVYLRVLTPGTVAAGDTVTVTHRPGHGVSVTRWFTAQHPDDARRLLEHEALLSGSVSGARSDADQSGLMAGSGSATSASGVTSRESWEIAGYLREALDRAVERVGAARI